MDAPTANVWRRELDDAELIYLAIRGIGAAFYRTLILGLLLSVSALCSKAQQTSPDQHVETMLRALTLEEKIDLIGGVSTWFTHEEPSIGLRALRLSDGPAGLRAGEPATAYPAPIALAASWDTSLAARMGTALALDARARGVDILLGPGVNIARAPMNGRNFEYMGEDPFLTSRIAVSYINGVQSQNVSATIKHFMMNNQEYNRHQASSDADERTMREIYLPSFEAAVKEAHVGAIMDSYNLVNGNHSTQNAWMNLNLAKKEWGFDGIIMSDWNAVYDGVAAAKAGLDLEMPFAKYMSRETLLRAIASGILKESVIDDKVRRILRTALRFHFVDSSGKPIGALLSAASESTALDVARESIVLLKNANATLPWKANSICTLAIIGPNAFPAVMGGGGSAIVDTYRSVSTLAGVTGFVKAHTTDTSTCHHQVLYDTGLRSRYQVFLESYFDHGLTQEIYPSRDWTGQATQTMRDHLNEDRIVSTKESSLRWTGTITANRPGQYYVIVHDGRPADRHRVFADGVELAPNTAIVKGELTYIPLPKLLRSGESITIRLDYLPADTEVYPGFGMLAEDDLLSDRAKDIASLADAVLLSAGFDKSSEHEGSDRTFALPPLQDVMIQTLAKLNRNTVLTLTAGGNLDMQPWIDDVPALLHLWYPGQEGGTALAEVLFGEVNPSGRLPVSFEMKWEDNPTFHSYYPDQAPKSSEPHINYSEGVFVGYRYYISPSANRDATRPRFPFGFGLSYTTFSFSNLRVSASGIRPGQKLTVTFDVKNTGRIEGSEVGQIYVGEQGAPIARPAYELKGFSKIHLAPGETGQVSIELNDRSFAYWSSTQHEWKIDRNRFAIYVGDSSENLPLHTEVKMEQGGLLQP